MRLELEVSDQNEGTASPWWVIIDPRQNTSTHGEQCIHNIAGMITGPFFSREAAQARLDGARHRYSPNARVYCMSACYARQYDSAYRDAEARRPE